MKRYTVLFALLLGMAAFMFSQANPQAPPPQTAPATAAPATTAPPPSQPTRDPDDDHNMNTAPQASDQQSPPAQTPDYSQPAPDRDRDQDNRSGQDVNRDRDNRDNQDRDRSQVYDRDQPYQDQDRRDQQGRDRDSNAERDRDRDRDNNNNVDRDRDNDMDRDHDRNRVGTGDVQSQIYSALHNDRNLSDVKVQVRGNRIDLTGTVPTGHDRNEAMRIAQSYGNGMRIDDHIKVSGRGHDRDNDNDKH